MDIDTLKFNENGLIPAVVQEAMTGEVLMVAYMNRESLEITLRDRLMTYWSRSRNKLWRKGETSGNLQEVVEFRKDCDEDTLLFKVRQIGGSACHTGHRSCFYRIFSDNSWVVDPEDNPENI